MNAASAARIAWCVVCDGPQECDERGCIVCATLREKLREQSAASSRKRRRLLSALGRCINGIAHPAPRNGVRCDACVEVHRRSR